MLEKTHIDTEVCHGRENTTVENCGHGILGEQWLGTGGVAGERRDRHPYFHYLPATVRDFHVTHIDFETTIATDRGFVDAVIGADRKPVYIGGCRHLHHAWRR